jgi:curli biogenesis system outer membrane secretion channel CsgG
MNRQHRIAAVACALALSLCVTGTAAAQEKIRIAVVDFDTEAVHATWHWGWHYSHLARAAADNLTTKLVQSGSFRVIERQQLDKVLGEQNLGAGGRIDPSTAAKVGKILGVQLVVIGSVTEFGINEKGGRIPQIGRWKWGRGVGAKVVTGRAKLTARLVDTTTAEILGAWDGESTHRFGKGAFAGANFGTDFDSGLASKVLAKAVETLAAGIAEGASGLDPSTMRGGLEGKIAKVDGGNVYLNIGADMGLKVGDRFEIRSLGEQIRDPDTGEVLGGEETVVGVVEVTKVIGGRLAIAKTVQGGGFMVGDRVVMK